jgi:[histone H3]-lysine36 N-trimethyltransferase
LVDSDFKHGRVEDIHRISDKQQQKIKKYCKDYFEKAVAKHRAHEKRKTERKGGHDENKDKDHQDESVSVTPQDAAIDDKESLSDLNASDDDNEPTGKRKREDNSNDDSDAAIEKGQASPMKRHKSSTPPRSPSSRLSPSKGLDEELQRSGISASHQSIGVVQ